MIHLHEAVAARVPGESSLRARRMGIDTYQEPVVYMRADCPVCRSEGFEAESRVLVTGNGRSLIATLNVVQGELLGVGDAGFSEAAWALLGVRESCDVMLSHPEPVESFGAVRAKLFDHTLSPADLDAIVGDVVARRYSDVQVSAFLAGCVGSRLSRDEVVALTSAMVSSGEVLKWRHRPVFDKHCVGGLPGNRTTPIVVAIAAASGLVMPKTSSRAITSPAGTADTMETLTRVDLSVAEMRRVVEREGGCVVWGGSVDLSPADELLIRVERALDLDSEGQLVASVLSKKIAAGSTHVLIDVPVGPTAKVRDGHAAERLSRLLKDTGSSLGLDVEVLLTDGTQPVGRGIGPALEARDVLAVLQGTADAPADLRQRAAAIAGAILEQSGTCGPGQGTASALRVIDDGRAWRKFQAICEAQGGLREPRVGEYQTPALAQYAGRVAAIDNRRLAKVAKLAGAPTDPAAGVELLVHVGDRVETDQPMLNVHAESPGELLYGLRYLSEHPDLIRIESDRASSP